MHGLFIELPWWFDDKVSALNAGDLRFHPWFGKIPWRREWQPTPIFLPGEFHGQWSLAGYSTVQFSCSIMSDSLWPYGLQYFRLPCPQPTPEARSNSCPLSWWCYPTISSSIVPFSSCLQSFSASGLSKESVLLIRWPKYWSFSFSISPSNEYSGLISFRISLVRSSCCPRDSKESFPTPQFKSINSSVLSLLHSPTLIHTWPQGKP